MCSKRKRALRRAMTQLEAEVADGQVKEGAHVRLAKRLMVAFHAPGDDGRRHVENYLLDALTDDPFGAMCVPLKHRHILEDPVFLRRLLHAKRKQGGAPIPDEWWADFLEGFLAGWFFDDKRDQSLLDIGRSCVVLLLSTRWNTLAPTLRRLDKLALVPSELFPLGDGEDVAHGSLDVWDALASDARFVAWLLQDGAGYAPEEAERLREYAFDKADAAAQRDAGWLRALGLRDLHDVMGLHLQRMLGTGFEDARRVVVHRRECEEA